MPVLSIVILFYEDVNEALDLVQLTRVQTRDDMDAEWVLVGLDPVKAGTASSGLDVPAEVRLIFCDRFRGLPHAKNLALRHCRGTFVLFLSPGLRPADNAIALLKSAIETHSGYGAVSGRWINRNGVVEKGYNVRRFPTYWALVFDVLFVNKLLPFNSTTRRFKMHDFDHLTGCQAEHANDVNFMARRDLLVELGGFDESYEIGWFDQVEMCRKIREHGMAVYFQPDAIFVSSEKESIINRLVADRYGRYYRDELHFVEREFGPAPGLAFRLILAVGMVIRISFTTFLTSRLRVILLKTFRSYVSEEYIMDMRPSYWAVLRGLLHKEGRRA